MGVEWLLSDLRAAVADINLFLYVAGARDGAIVTAVLLVLLYLWSRK